MSTILIILIVLIFISIILNMGYIFHKLGWYPQTWDRKKPKEAYTLFTLEYLTEKKISHDFQVLHGWNYDRRKLGHKEIYSMKDPYKALEKVIEDYKIEPTKNRFDDLIHLSNFISNKIRYDDKINTLVEQISEITINPSNKK